MALIPDGGGSAGRPTDWKPAPAHHAAAWNQYFKPQAGGWRPGTQDYRDFGAAYDQSASNPMASMFPGGMFSSGAGGGGGGFGRRGGGGGGGGGPAPLDPGVLAQLGAMFNQRPQAQQFSPLQLQQFQGRPQQKFDSSLWDQLSGRVTQAGERDQQAARQAYDQLGQTLGSTFSNAYQNAPQTATPQVQASMSNLLASQGMDPAQYQGGVDAENAYSQNSDAAFSNLLAVLGANEQAGQDSRMRQVEMDANTARQGIQAQTSGLGAGVDMSRARSQQEWDNMERQRLDMERMMNWQNQNQQATANWQGQNQTNAANTGMNNEWWQQNMGALLQLLPMLGQGQQLPQMQGWW